MDYSPGNRSPAELIARSAVGTQALTRELAYLLFSTYAAYVGAFDACRRRQSASHVHDLRVSTRRLRVMISLCEAAGPSELGRRMRRILRRPFRIAGRLRDRQVARAMLKDEAHRNPDAPVLFKWLAPRNARDRQRLRAVLRRRRAAKLNGLVAELGRHLLHSAGQPKRSRRIVAAAAAVVAEIQQDLAESSSEGIQTSDMHQLRIRLKRLRYALELLQPALDPTLRGKIGDLRVLQRELGEITDRGMLIERIHAYISKHPDRGRWLVGLESRLRGEREARAHRARTQLARMQDSGRSLSTGIA